jgi:hypothetical protein
MTIVEMEGDEELMKKLKKKKKGYTRRPTETLQVSYYR